MAEQLTEEQLRQAHGLQFHLEGTAGTLRLWKSMGRMTGTGWAMTDTESPDKIRMSPDRFNLKQMKARAYKLPEGTPDRWAKVKENPTSKTRPGPLPVEKMTIAPIGQRRQTFYLEITNETADWITGKQLKNDGQWAMNKQGQNIIQMIDKAAIVKRTPVEMNLRYGEYEEVKTVSNPKLPKTLYSGDVHHLTQYYIKDSRWAEESVQPSSTRRSHTVFECLTCHDLMSTERKFSDSTPQQQRARIADWKKIHSHRKENPMSNPTSCTGCGKAISGAYEAGSYSCSGCGAGVEVNPVKAGKNPSSNPLTAKKRKDVERALDNHEKLKGSYFWKNLGNASSRRNDEKRYNFGVKVEHKGDVYTYDSHVQVSTRNFYYTGDFRKNDKRGDVRIFKKLLAAM